MWGFFSRMLFTIYYFYCKRECAEILFKYFCFEVHFLFFGFASDEKLLKDKQDKLNCKKSGYLTLLYYWYDKTAYQNFGVLKIHIVFQARKIELGLGKTFFLLFHILATGNQSYKSINILLIRYQIQGSKYSRGWRKICWSLLILFFSRVLSKKGKRRSFLFETI